MRIFYTGLRDAYIVRTKFKAGVYMSFWSAFTTIPLIDDDLESQEYRKLLTLCETA